MEEEKIQKGNNFITIDGGNKSLRRKYIKDTVDTFKILYPELYQGAIEHSKQVKKQNFDVYGSEYGISKLEASRHLLSIPTKLCNAIENGITAHYNYSLLRAGL